MSTKSTEQSIEELEKCIQERINRAITNEIRKNKHDHSILVKDNRQFKEAVSTTVKALKIQNERLVNGVVNDMKSEVSNRLHRWNSALGGIKTNWGRKLREGLEEERRDRQHAIGRLGQQLLQSNSLIRHRVKMAMLIGTIGLLLSFCNLGLVIYLLVSGGGN